MASLTTTVGLANHFRVSTAGLTVASGPCGSTSRSVGRLSSRRTYGRGDHEIWRSALSWTSSTAFGKPPSVFVPIASYAPGAGLSLAVTALTQEQAKMVKESWKLVQKNDPGKHAMNFFLKVFEIAPSAKRLFSFLKDSPVPTEKNPKLKTHALQVFIMTGDAAVELGEKGTLDAVLPKLLELGHTHADYGVVDEHFDVVGYALLATLAEALPEKWNPELREAWAVAYDEVVHVIKEEMKVVRREQAEPNLVAK